MVDSSLNMMQQIVEINERDGSSIRASDKLNFNIDPKLIKLLNRILDSEQAELLDTEDLKKILHDDLGPTIANDLIKRNESFVIAIE